MPAASYEKLENSLFQDYFKRALLQTRALRTILNSCSIQHWRLGRSKVHRFGQHFLEKLPTTLKSMMNASKGFDTAMRTGDGHSWNVLEILIVLIEKLSQL